MRTTRTLVVCLLTAAGLGDEQRDVVPGDLISIPRRVPHSFEQKGAETFVTLVNATPGWDPLKATRYLE